MANKKISELTNINNPSLSSIAPVVVNNITYKTSLQNLRQVLVDNGSHVFTGSQTINGDLTISGSLIAQQYIISSSYINVITENISGSTNFGNTEDDVHNFTGSVYIDGNISSIGTGSMSNLIIGFGTFNESNPEVLHAESSGSFNIAHYQGDFVSYAQVNLKNINSGNIASGDIVITADNGTEEIHYVDLGINSSTYDAGYVGYENDAYLINAGKDLYLGTIGGLEEHPSKVHIFTNNSWENSQIIISPTKEISFNTGSVTSGYTYEFSGSLKLQNELNVDGSVTASFFVGDGSQLINLPTQSISNLATTGSNTFYGDQIIIGNIESDFYVKTQYISAPTSSQQIVITGDANKDTSINVYAADGVELILLEVETSIWEFQNGGIMKFPDDTYQNTAFTTSSIAGFATTGSNTFVGNQNITGSINLTGDIIRNGSPGLAISSSHNAYIITDAGDNNRTWTFDGTGGDILFPNGAQIGDDGDGIGNTELRIPAIGGGYKTWTFGSNGILKLNNGISEIYSDVDDGYVRIGTAPQNVAPNTQLILGGPDSVLTITSGPPTIQWKFEGNGDFNLTGSINGASNLATTGSNTFLGNQIINGNLNTISISKDVISYIDYPNNIEFDFTNSSTFYITGSTSNGNYNVINVPETEDKSIEMTFVIKQGFTPYSGSSYLINGSGVDVKWLNNIIPTGSANKIDIIELNAFRISSSWIVVGSLSTFG